MAIIVDFPSSTQDAYEARRKRLMTAASLYLGVKLELMQFGASEPYAADRAREARSMYLKTTRKLGEQAQNGGDAA